MYPASFRYHRVTSLQDAVSLLAAVGEDGDHNTGGVLSTAMRIVNAIPDVVAARPGMLSTLDLPVTPGRHLMPE